MDVFPHMRGHDWCLIHQKLSIEVDLWSNMIAGYSELTLCPRSNDVSELFLHFRQGVVRRVLVNSIAVEAKWRQSRLDAVFEAKDPHRDLRSFETTMLEARKAAEKCRGGGLYVTLPEGLMSTLTNINGNGNLGPLPTIKVRVEYLLEQPVGGVTFVTPNTRSFPDRSPFMFTESEVNSPSLWFPCIDAFCQRATWAINVTVEAPFIVVASGDLEKHVYTDASKAQKTYFFKLDVPTAARDIGIAVGPFEVRQDPQLPFVTHFCLPGRGAELGHTTAFFAPAIECCESALKRPFPYNTYKQVFLDETYVETHSYAGVAVLSSELLHGPRIINQTMPSRIAQWQALSTQWFGRFLSVHSWNDMWLVRGLSQLLLGHCITDLLGHTTWKLWVRDCFETACDMSSIHPPLKDPNFILPWSLLTDYSLQKSFCAIRVMESMLGEEEMSIIVTKLVRNAEEASRVYHDSNASMESAARWGYGKGGIGSPLLLRSADVMRLLQRKQMNADQPRTFEENWITGVGFPHFHVTVEYNKKNNKVDVNIRQSAIHGNSNSMFPSSMTFKVQELSGVFPHEKRVEKKHERFSLDCHGKSRRAKKKRVILEGGKEVDIELADADTCVLWVRPDPEFVMFRHISVSQKSFMWEAQATLERDVASQLDAARMMRRVPGPRTTSVLLSIASNSNVHYKVRVMSIYSLAATASSDRTAVEALIRFFKEQFFDLSTKPAATDSNVTTGNADGVTSIGTPATPTGRGTPGTPSGGGNENSPTGASAPTTNGSDLVRCNDFRDFALYYVQCAVVHALGGTRVRQSSTAGASGGIAKISATATPPLEVMPFLLDLLKYNDNTGNVYSDDYYITALLRGLAATVTSDTLKTDANEMLAEFAYQLNRDKLMLSHNGIVSSASLEGLCQLQVHSLVPLDVKVFHDHTVHGHPHGVRVTAVQCLVRLLVTSKNRRMNSLVLLKHLLNIIRYDPVPRLRSVAVCALTDSDLVKHIGFKFLTDNVQKMLVHQLWETLTCRATGADARLRICMALLYKELYDVHVPDCVKDGNSSAIRAFDDEHRSRKRKRRALSDGEEGIISSNERIRHRHSPAAPLSTPVNIKLRLSSTSSPPSGFLSAPQNLPKVSSPLAAPPKEDSNGHIYSPVEDEPIVVDEPEAISMPSETELLQLNQVPIKETPHFSASEIIDRTSQPRAEFSPTVTSDSPEVPRLVFRINSNNGNEATPLTNTPAHVASQEAEPPADVAADSAVESVVPSFKLTFRGLSGTNNGINASVDDHKVSSSSKHGHKHKKHKKHKHKKAGHN